VSVEVAPIEASSELKRRLVEELTCVIQAENQAMAQREIFDWSVGNERKAVLLYRLIGLERIREVKSCSYVEGGALCLQAALKRNLELLRAQIDARTMLVAFINALINEASSDGTYGIPRKSGESVAT
jgi:hypothetical protein